eukprot:362159-Chlamydomonas_euryale.AAC.21
MLLGRSRSALLRAPATPATGLQSNWLQDPAEQLSGSRANERSRAQAPTCLSGRASQLQKGRGCHQDEHQPRDDAQSISRRPMAAPRAACGAHTTCSDWPRGVDRHADSWGKFAKPRLLSLDTQQ